MEGLGWLVNLLVISLLVVGRAQEQLQLCRDCTIGDCLAVPRAEGGCEACICNGLLMSDCQQLNCSSNCAQQPTPDGCFECVCPDAVQNVCPPIPACPSRCQVQLGNGCPRCTCPDELPCQCPTVMCPPTCTEVTGPDGCPACDCPPEEKVCPEMPACPLGCIDQSEDPMYAECLACNCTIIEELLSENQIIPDEPTNVRPTNFDVELVTMSVDSGLIAPIDLINLNLTPSENIDLTVGNPTETLIPTIPEDPVPTMNTPVPNSDMPQTPALSNPLLPQTTDNSGLDISSNNIDPTIENPSETLSPATLQDSVMTQNTPAQNTDMPQTPALPNPFLPETADNSGANIPIAPRVGSNHRSQNSPNHRRRRPPVNIPCGETSCPPGCTLCIQNNSCGRCLCGNSARICPAVPACQPACITPGPNGCFTCNCPAPGNFLQQRPTLQIGPSLGPHIFATALGFDSEEVFVPRPRRPGPTAFMPFVRGVRARPSPQRGNRGPSSGRRGPPRGGPSPGQIVIQNIPPHLLGESRFQIFV